MTYLVCVCGIHTVYENMAGRECRQKIKFVNFVLPTDSIKMRVCVDSDSTVTSYLCNGSSHSFVFPFFSYLFLCPLRLSFFHVDLDLNWSGFGRLVNFVLPSLLFYCGESTQNSPPFHTTR